EKRRGHSSEMRLDTRDRVTSPSNLSSRVRRAMPGSARIRQSLASAVYGYIAAPQRNRAAELGFQLPLSRLWHRNCTGARLTKDIGPRFCKELESEIHIPSDSALI